MAKSSRSAMRSFYLVGVIMFTLFAALQVNDATQYGNHDAWIWIVLYGTAATINLFALLRQVSLSYLYVWFGFCAGGLLFRIQDDAGNLRLNWLNPSQYLDNSGAMVQQTNESGGLVILLLWVLIHIWAARRAAQ